MKKLFLVLIAAMTIFFGSSFKPNTTSRQVQSNATPQQDQCYRVKVIYDIVYETRTARWGGTVVNSKTMATDQVYTTPQCASSESEARDQAVHECYEACNNQEGKYIKETSDGLYMFEVRRVKRTEITGSCGNCGQCGKSIFMNSGDDESPLFDLGSFVTGFPSVHEASQMGGFCFNKPKVKGNIQMSVEDELQELNRRAEEMENNPSVCIPHEEVYEMVITRIKK